METARGVNNARLQGGGGGGGGGASGQTTYQSGSDGEVRLGRR